jgi:hypothetical protein
MTTMMIVSLAWVMCCHDQTCRLLLLALELVELTVIAI